MGMAHNETGEVTMKTEGTAAHTGGFIGTYNGTKFWVSDPRAEDVNIEAIAHALAYNIRFNGNTSKPWSVAQHSLMVALIAEKLCTEAGHTGLDPLIAKYIGLLHDASEGYMSDIARPFKSALSEYLHLESVVSGVIYDRMGVSKDDCDRLYRFVKEADNIALGIEAKALMNPCKEWEEFGDFNSESVLKYEKLMALNVENPQYVKGRLLSELLLLSDRLFVETSWVSPEMAPDIPLIMEAIRGRSTPIILQGKLMYTIETGMAAVRICSADRKPLWTVPYAEFHNSVDVETLVNCLKPKE